jgi:hypothetical protein
MTVVSLETQENPADSPPPCGEGLGVGGFQDRPGSPSPYPLPAKWEGILLRGCGP